MLLILNFLRFYDTVWQCGILYFTTPMNIIFFLTSMNKFKYYPGEVKNTKKTAMNAHNKLYKLRRDRSKNSSCDQKEHFINFIFTKSE